MEDLNKALVVIVILCTNEELCEPLSHISNGF